ncbi:LLM class flavin-dependent oxidoreductase [Microbacterium lushaniae]|uniref:LLM class flavin-dependent oxidoreductase n=1 Tax=Microbacterium lushaniae TaxID=2614639 RepID=A0A5J6L3W4_9MICO|nr:LLM class flavin-dependent oxidoreductase [Microbacterium lushaniae]
MPDRPRTADTESWIRHSARWRRVPSKEARPMVARPNRQMTLTIFMTAFGYHNDAWMHPTSRADEIGQLSIIRDMAQAAERAKLDAIFIADSVSAQPLQRSSYRGVSVYEPVVTLSALTGHTDKIGLIGTQSTTFNEPYTVARQFAALDMLSGGRAGWNIVTSINGNENYGRDLPPRTGDTSAPRSSWTSSRSCGTPGTRMRSSTTARAGCGSIQTGSDGSITSVSISASRVPSRSRVRHRTSRCWCRPASPPRA